MMVVMVVMIVVLIDILFFANRNVRMFMMMIIMIMMMVVVRVNSLVRDNSHTAARDEHEQHRGDGERVHGAVLLESLGMMRES